MRRDGLGTAIRRAFVNFKHGRSADKFDLRYGTVTGGIEPLWRFKISSTNARFGARYEATNEKEFTDAVNFLREDPKSFIFIDLGCGKGRVLLMAASLGFKQIIGVEFASELVEIARSNIAKRKITNAVVLHADAADFQFQNCDTVIYLYNPFSQEVVRKIVKNLREFQSNKLYIIYKNPLCAEVFDSSGFLKRFGGPPESQQIQIWTAFGF